MLGLTPDQIYVLEGIAVLLVVLGFLSLPFEE